MEKAKLVSLPKILDKRGNLSVIESDNHVPFSIKRTYLIYDVPGGEVRGGHAFFEQKEMVVALSGSFDVEIEDGDTKKVFTLNRPYEGLYVCPGIWRELTNFSSGSVCLVLASNLYSEDDYYRDYDEFLSLQRA